MSKSARLVILSTLPGPDDAGVDIVLNTIMKIDQVGTWWFDIYVNDERWVRLPLRWCIYLNTSSSLQAKMDISNLPSDADILVYRVGSSRVN
jgi:hypothetical protein